MICRLTTPFGPALAATFRAALGISLGTVLAALLAAAPARAGAQPTVVIVVRHAEKAAAPANDPPLTAAGEARARALAAALADANVQAVLSTPTLRTTATAAPTAAARGLTTEIIPVAGGTPVHAAAVAAAIRQYHRGQTVLVVEHSNTVAAIVRALGGPSVPDLCDGQYASLFTLVFGDGPDAGAPRLVRSSYGAPDAPDAAGCTPVTK